MKGEADAFLAKANESLAAGRLLAEHRFNGKAAGQAYYAMFYAASAWMLTLGHRFKSHKGLIGAFAQAAHESDVLPTELGAMLRDAFDARLLGDYAPARTVPEEEAGDLLANAERFLAEIEAGLARRR